MRPTRPPLDECTDHQRRTWIRMDRVGQQSISTTTRDGQKRVPKRDSFTLPTLLKGHTKEMYKEQRERVLLDADRSVTDRDAN